MVPPPAGLLKVTRERWGVFWESPLAAAVLATDHVGLARWIRSVDEWERAMRAFRRRRIVDGSTGQPVLNPLAAYIVSREAAIREAEEKYGMTPLARLKLGIAVGQARLTAAELNKALQQEEQDDGDPNGDWEEA